MTLAITHSTVATLPDEAGKEVNKDEWNDDHVIAGLGTGVETALGVAVGSPGSVITNGGNAGTPSAIVLTNATGTAAGLTAGTASAVAVGGITGLGTGVATALAVNVGSAGAFVTFNGALGTPSSGVATNLTGTATGLTAGVASAVAVGGITGLGTGVATALAVNVGTAGAPVVLNGAGGTPSSLTLTNATGLPVAGGGTGSTTARAAAAALGVPFILAKSAVAVSGAADTAENILATITVPANAMGANGAVRVRGKVTVSVAAPVWRIRYSGIGGTIILTWTPASAQSLFDLLISNRNATNSQIVAGWAASNGAGLSGFGSNIVGTADTTAETTIVITVQKTVGVQVATMEQYLAELLSDGT